MTPPASDHATAELVTLTGGLVVPRPALEVLWSLENRGARFELDGTGILVRPKALLTEEDRSVIRRYRQAVIAVLQYQADDSHLRVQ